MADHFEGIVGPMHLSTLYFRIRLSDVHSNEGYTSLKMVQNLLAEFETNLGPHDGRSLLVRHCLMMNYLSKSNHIEAKKVGQRFSCLLPISATAGRFIALSDSGSLHCSTVSVHLRRRGSSNSKSRGNDSSTLVGMGLTKYGL